MTKVCSRKIAGRVKFQTTTIAHAKELALKIKRIQEMAFFLMIFFRKERLSLDGSKSMLGFLFLESPKD